MVFVVLATLVSWLGWVSFAKQGRRAVETPPKSLPKVVVVGPLTHEFGTIPQLTTGKWTWLVKDAGNRDLELWKGTSSPNVRKIFKDDSLSKKDEKAILKPNETTEVELAWKAGRNTYGDFKRGFNLETNDPETPTVSLFVHGTIEPMIAVLPGERINLNKLHDREPRNVRAALYSPGRPNLKVEGIDGSEPDYFTAEASPMSPKDLQERGIGGGWNIDVRIKPGMPIGPVREEVVVYTDHPRRPEVVFVLFGSVIGSISAAPERLRMADVKTSEGGVGEVMLTTRERLPSNIHVVRKPEKLDVSVEPVEQEADAGGRYRVKVAVPRETAPGYIDDEIVIETDLPEGRELRIPVNVLVGAG
jgi:hypothetical protein